MPIADFNLVFHQRLYGIWDKYIRHMAYEICTEMNKYTVSQKRDPNIIDCNFGKE